MKKLMLLGGSRYLVPVIEKAHELGLYVITCDYLPDNIAHKFSDEYCNVSVIDKKEVLKQAQKRGIEGIMSFACDPGVITAAYVAEKMGLPFQCSYKATTILQDKGLFRQFLQENGFISPHAKRYEGLDELLDDIDYFTWPVIVKPVDSAGSKGVSKVDSPSELRNAVATALSKSHCGAFIVEDFLTFEGFHSSTDVFTIDGKVEFISFSDQLFDKTAENPYTPAYIIWPTTMENKYQKELTSEIQRLMAVLDVRTGIYNIETCVGNGGRPYIMEVSPRGGGCKIAEIQKMIYGVDLIEAEVRKAVGMPVNVASPRYDEAVWCEMVIHAKSGQSGYFEKLEIREDIRNNHVKTIDLGVEKGNEVFPFTGASAAIGDVFLRCDSREHLDELIAGKDKWINIILR